MSAPSLVYVVEDDPAVRDALTLLFGLNGFSVQAFSSAEDFLERVDAPVQGCVVIDYRLPGLDGLELTRRVRDRSHGAPCVVISGHGDIAAARRAFKLGAVDFLEKPLDEPELIEIVRRALARYRDATMRQADAMDLCVRLQSLTEREREVFAMVARGMPAREVAGALEISPRTVEVHRSRAMEKLGARRLSDLARIAEQLAQAGFSIDK